MPLRRRKDTPPRAAASAIAIVVAFAAAVGIVAALVHRDEIAAGDLVPSFTIQTSDGPVELGAMQGRAHLLIFAGPDCSHCRVALPALDAALRRVPVAVLPRWVVWEGSRASWKIDRRKLALTLPCGTTETSWRRLGVRRLPAILLVGSDARVERVWRGEDSLSDAVAYLSGLVGRREYVGNRVTGTSAARRT